MVSALPGVEGVGKIPCGLPCEAACVCLTNILCSWCVRSWGGPYTYSIEIFSLLTQLYTN